VFRNLENAVFKRKIFRNRCLPTRALPLPRVTTPSGSLVAALKNIDVQKIDKNSQKEDVNHLLLYC